MRRIPFVTCCLLAVSLGSPAIAQEDSTMAVFVVGRGGAAAKSAVGTQHAMRELVPTTGSFKLLDLDAALDPGEPPQRKLAVEDAIKLLTAGKESYEQLDLEEAQSKFDMALKKFEYGYGYLTNTSPLVETLMYLGASWVLVGEDEKATKTFMRACDLPSRKALSTDAFPPNIQEIFQAAKAEVEGAAKGAISVTTKPQGAEVWIDNEFKGGSPLRVENLRVGNHLVRGVKDGFRPWGGKVAVPTGKLKRYKLKLKPTQNQKRFSERFRAMAAEISKEKPGPQSAEMARFLDVDTMILMVLQGEENAMAFTGYMCRNAKAELKISESSQTFDVTAADFPEKQKEYLLKILAGDFGEGAAGAAGLLAAADGGEGKSGDSLGMDLGEGDGKTAAGADGSSSTGGGDVKAEQQREKELADKIREDGKKKPEDEAAFSWGYLQDKWWFWTAVGVVVAGVVVGTTVGCLPSESESGTLVIGLH
ncbi:MAG: PEGA domain-containing protein [Deltaproteobacteria bacterium]|nr:PEGA domain-containing protein [Deltaproteobacteria bacterium]